jgi:hypothetical protein
MKGSTTAAAQHLLRATTTFQRQHFSVSRAAEYFTAGELQAQAERMEVGR